MLRLIKTRWPNSFQEKILSPLKGKRIDIQQIHVVGVEFVRGGFGEVRPAILEGHPEQVAVKETRVVGSAEQRLRVEKVRIQRTSTLLSRG